MQSKTDKAPLEGYGPWYVFLMINVQLDNNSSKKQTEIVLDSHPDRYRAIHNHLHSKWGVNMWIICLTIGPFNDWFHANHIRAAWLHKSRGQPTRIARGLALADKLHLPHMATECSREDIVALLRNQKKEKQPNSILNIILEKTKHRPTPNNKIRMYQINEL